jgi:cytoskeletal protein RodZ
VKTARPQDQRFSGKSSRLREPKEPEEIVVYLWGRIFAALFVLILVVGGIIWGALEIFGAGEQKEALAENQEVEAPPLPPVFVDESSSAEPASIQLPKTASREQSESDANAGMPDQTNSVQTEVAETPAAVSETSSGAASSDSSAEPAPPPLASQVSEPESSIDPGSLPAPAAGESEPPREDTASIELLSDHIIRAQLSTGLEEKEPIDEIPNVLTMNSDGLIRIYLFTEIQGMEGQLHFHDWYLEDERVARVEIRPSVDPMRASSAKYIDRHMVGDWRVEVVTEEGELLAKGEFSVLPL